MDVKIQTQTIGLTSGLTQQKVQYATITRLQKIKQNANLIGVLGGATAMQLEGNNLIHASPEVIYAALQNPEVLAKCVPGVKTLVPDGEGVYKTSLEVALGPVKGVFQGKVSVLDQLLNQAMTLKVEMRAPVGVASAVGRVTLYPEESATRVHWAGEPQLGGMIASVGARLLGGVAKAQADLFFAALEKEIGQTMSSGH